MSAVGAKLQTCNEQLVYLIEDLKKKLDKLDDDISNDIKEKDRLTAELQIITRNLDRVNESLNEKLAMKSEYSDTLNEAENAYLKVYRFFEQLHLRILESSETLISVVKMKSLKLGDKQSI